MKASTEFKSITMLDKLIHEPSRLSIMSILSVVEESDFLFIMNNTGLSQGNLSSHLSKLEESDYIIIEKTFKGKRPHTIIRISNKGSTELNNYLKIMKEFLKSF